MFRSRARLQLVLACAVLAIAALSAVTAPEARAGGDSPNLRSCAVKADHTAWCWGLLGEWNAMNLTGTPRQVVGLSDVASVSVDVEDACALTRTGTVKCWGGNSSGQLGDGTTTDSTTPVDVLGLTDARSVDTGQTSSCAVRVTGTVVCWGRNDNQQLGTTSVPTVSPEPVPGITDAIAVTDAANHRCALLADGHVVCWGDNGSGGNLGDGTTNPSSTPVQVSGLSDVQSISAGNDSTCAVKTDGTLWCWGGTMIGNGTLSTGSAVPVQVPGISDASLVQTGYTTCVVHKTGAVSCWGYLTTEQVAGLDQPTASPVSIPGFTDATGIVESIWGTVCATRTGGSVSCSGLSAYGSLGNGREPMQLSPDRNVQDLDHVVGIDVSSAFACGVTSSHTLKCWGIGPFGDNPTGPIQLTWSASAVPGGSNVESVSVAHEMGCAVMTDHTVSCLGRGSYGALGNGDTSDSYLSPVTVSGLQDAESVATGAYGHQACAVRTGGSVVCWGSNGHGELGDGTTTNSSTPVAVSGITDAREAAVFTDNSCVLRTTGAVSCWGAIGGSTPTDMGITDGVSISAGEQHVCVALSSGSVKCLGPNSVGQLGDGTTSDSSSFVTVAGLTNARAVSAAYASTCARTDDGVSCWGEIGAYLGGGENAQRAPQAVAGLSGATAVATGRTSACAIKADGHAACWGLAAYPTLGDGVGPLGHGPQAAPHCVIGFCSDPSGPDTGDDDATDEDEDAAPAPPAPKPSVPVLLPPKAPVLLPVAPQVRLTGRTVVLTKFTLQRRGKVCPRTATARMTVGRTAVVKRLRVTTLNGACVATTSFRLPAAASKLTSLRVRVSGTGVRTRTVVAKRS